MTLLYYRVRAKVANAIRRRLWTWPATPSFAQAGEDVVLRNLMRTRANGFKDPQRGFYIDVGAYHPTHFSNTYLFYLRGWRGINIDAQPGSMAAFRRARPRDINLEVAIGGAGQELAYHVVPTGPAMNSFSPQFLENIGVDPNASQQMRMKLEPLSSVLRTHLPPGQGVDFLTVDVEGLEMDVLSSLDWDAVRPFVVLVEELWEANGSPSRVVPFLTNLGYEVVVDYRGFIELPGNRTVRELFFRDVRTPAPPGSLPVPGPRSAGQP